MLVKQLDAVIPSFLHPAHRVFNYDTRPSKNLFSHKYKSLLSFSRPFRDKQARDTCLLQAHSQTHTWEWAQERKRLDIYVNFQVVSAEDGSFTIEYVSFHFGNVSDEQQAQTVKDILADWETKVTPWEESDETGWILAELQRTRLKLKDEFNTITMRRTVPRHCKYCPI